MVFEQWNFSYRETWRQNTNFARLQASTKKIWESNLSNLILLFWRSENRKRFTENLLYRPIYKHNWQIWNWLITWINMAAVITVRFHNLGSQMGLNLTESDISVSHRLPNNNSYSSRLKQGKVNPVSQIPKLIVKFVRRDTKELFYKSRKHLKGITTKDLGLSRLSENKIYISESLSPRNREIFKACLKFKERNYFKYIWTQQGRIYLRKNSDTPTRIITCQDDLNNLQPSWSR